MKLEPAPVAVALAVLFAVTGCAPATPESAYLSTVRDEIPALSGESDADLIDLADFVCDAFQTVGFDDGMTRVIDLAKSAGMTAGEAGTIAGASAAAYCPEFEESFSTGQ